MSITTDPMTCADGIHPKAVKLLKGKAIKPSVIDALRDVQPVRQIAVAKLMMSLNNYTRIFAEALLLGTPANHLAAEISGKVISGISSKTIALMESEMKSLERDFEQIRDRYGREMLELIVVQRYVRRLIENGKVSQLLKSRYSGMFLELEAFADLKTL